MPGIEVGDIGPKFGINSNDNGYLRFNKVRIPRRQMLMRHAKVLENGEYVRPLHPKVNYSSMMYVRAVMVLDQAVMLGMACTVAIRYSCVRRQGELQKGAGEIKILDYKTQQYRLFPALARTYAMFVAGRFIANMYRKVIEAVNIEGNVSTLIQDAHSLSSGLKSVCSYQTALGIEQCRMACGGHGYSQASGLPHLYTIAVGGCTYEGENIVMLLQTARFLMKCAKVMRERTVTNATHSFLTSYLFEPAARSVGGLQKGSQYKTATVMAFNHLARSQIMKAYESLEVFKHSGMRPEVAWNEASIELIRAARLHTRRFLVQNFVNFVETIEANDDVKEIMEDLLNLYLSYELLDSSAGLLEDGYLTSKDMENARDVLSECLRKIRVYAVAIVDSFGFSDRELNSVIGRRDGNVYENLLKWARKQPINKMDVLPFHDKYLGEAMREAKQRENISGIQSKL